MSMLNEPRQLDALLPSHQSDCRGGGGNQSPPSHTWSGSLIAEMFQDGCKDWITEPVVLAPGAAILFFGRHLCKEGLPYTSAKDAGFSLTDPVNWAGRTAQVEVTANMVKWGCQAIPEFYHGEEDEAHGARVPLRVGESHLALSWHL